MSVSKGAYVFSQIQERIPAIMTVFRSFAKVQRTDRYPSEELIPGMHPPLEKILLDGDLLA